MKNAAPDPLHAPSSDSEPASSSAEPPGRHPYSYDKRPDDRLIAEAIRTRQHNRLKTLLDKGANPFKPVPPVQPKGVSADFLTLERDRIAYGVKRFEHLSPRESGMTPSPLRTTSPALDMDSSSPAYPLVDPEERHLPSELSELHEDVASNIIYTSCEALRAFQFDDGAHALRTLNDNALAIAGELQPYRRRPERPNKKTDTELFGTASTLNRLFAARFVKENGPLLTNSDHDAAALKQHSLRFLYESLIELSERPNPSLAEIESTCNKPTVDRQTEITPSPFAPVGNATQGVHALRLALAEGNEEAALLLANYRHDHSSYTFAHLAAERNEADVLDWTLERFPELLQQPTNLGYSPLMLGCQYGSPDSVHVLLTRGADPNLGEQPSLSPLPSNTPLILTARHAEINNITDHALDDSLTIARSLIRHGARVDQVNWVVGASALHYAAEKCSAEMCELLLNQKPEMANATDSFGRTPLHYVALGEKEFTTTTDERVISALIMLMKYGAEPRAEASEILADTSAFNAHSNQFLCQKVMPFHEFSLGFRKHLTTEEELSVLNTALNPEKKYVKPYYFGSRLPKRSSSFDGFLSAARSISLPTLPFSSKTRIQTLNRTASEAKRSALSQSGESLPRSDSVSLGKHVEEPEKISRASSSHTPSLRSRSFSASAQESIPSSSASFRKSYAQSFKKADVKVSKFMTSAARLCRQADADTVHDPARFARNASAHSADKGGRDK